MKNNGPNYLLIFIYVCVIFVLCVTFVMALILYAEAAYKPMTEQTMAARFEIPRGASIPQPKAEHLRAYIEEGELAPAAAETDAPVSLGTFKLTAYCACEKCCGEYANGYTATGTLATEGRTIAVDPRVIPYGTHVLINGHEYVAEDCGGGIKQNRIDVFFGSHDAALRFGVGEAEVFVYEVGRKMEN